VASTAPRGSAARDQPARGRHRSTRSAGPSPVRQLASESLFRNSAFLVANLVFSAACGYGALSLLTRLYSVQAVGLSATAASASGLIVFIMQFGANYSLPRFLPSSKHRTALINTVLTATLLASLVAAVLFLLLPVAGKLYALGGALFAVAFLVATCCLAGEGQLGTVLIADRASSNVAMANFVPNLIKVAAPAAFLFAGSLGAYAARVVADVIGFGVLAVLVARRGQRFRPALSLTATRDIRRFSLGMYVASLLGSLPLMVLPVIILVRFGSSQAAYWSVAIAIASLLYQLPSTVGQALLPEIAHRPSERRHLVRRSAVLVCSVVIPVLVIAYVAAPLGLALFGKQYVAGTLVTLRWLIVAGLVTVLNYASGAVLFLAKKTFVISVVNVVDAVILLGLALTWATGVRGVAISWLIGDVSNTVLFAVFAVVAVRQVHGRWEDLGGPHTAEVDPSPFYPATAASQQQALEVLLRIARTQQGTPPPARADPGRPRSGHGTGYDRGPQAPSIRYRDRDRRDGDRPDGDRPDRDRRDGDRPDRDRRDGRPRPPDTRRRRPS
jgi:O-antigen/teichoic acid export membrane protein